MFQAKNICDEFLTLFLKRGSRFIVVLFERKVQFKAKKKEVKVRLLKPNQMQNYECKSWNFYVLLFITSTYFNLLFLIYFCWCFIVY